LLPEHNIEFPFRYLAFESEVVDGELDEDHYVGDDDFEDHRTEPWEIIISKVFIPWNHHESDQGEATKEDLLGCSNFETLVKVKGTEQTSAAKEDDSNLRGY
jgi:hypothetical protein